MFAYMRMSPLLLGSLNTSLARSVVWPLFIQVCSSSLRINVVGALLCLICERASLNFPRSFHTWWEKCQGEMWFMPVKAGRYVHKRGMRRKLSCCYKLEMLCSALSIRNKPNRKFRIPEILRTWNDKPSDNDIWHDIWQLVSLAQWAPVSYMYW